MIHFGLQLHPQYTSWSELRDGACAADTLGYDSLHTWDHFVPLYGDPSGPSLEGWELLAAWGAITNRVKVGLLVGANSFRHPALVARMAVTLDHITSGRAILGIGAGNHADEHAAYGFPFEAPSERLRRLREATKIIRALLENERTSVRGRFYSITDASCEPKPVQERLPILIGGMGEQVTLRIAARYADIWHGFGSPEAYGAKLAVLARHCRSVGRESREILPLVHANALIRDTTTRIEARLAEVRARHRQTTQGGQPLSGDPETIAQYLAVYWRAGARGFIFGMGAPFDHETIERLVTEVRPRLIRLVGAA